MIRHLIGMFLCARGLHDTGTKQTGMCRRASTRPHYVYADGSTRS